MQETIVFGGGCFWCTEAVFRMLKGVRSVEPGYAGSPKAEAVKIGYDPEQIAFEELLHVFFKSHDPGIIFCTTEKQYKKARHYIQVLTLPAKVEMAEEKFKTLTK
ncbi:MAG: Peptide methionine sulfoxide reductase MsrA [Parcubacteria group bacterium GW2011_GWA1_53_13]|nr:MAG: Peptide methionine sulfoxide reductase MsrA [Parcubacteria group bacterium GW2011_GWA1_53_13]